MKTNKSLDSNSNFWGCWKSKSRNWFCPSIILSYGILVLRVVILQKCNANTSNLSSQTCVKSDVGFTSIPRKLIPIHHVLTVGKFLRIYTRMDYRCTLGSLICTLLKLHVIFVENPVKVQLKKNYMREVTWTERRERPRSLWKLFSVLNVGKFWDLQVRFQYQLIYVYISVVSYSWS